jgi:iron complex transport system substrate-binding protein
MRRSKAGLCAILAFAFGPDAGVAAAPPPPTPHHVMSLDLCADQLLLQLLPPERIASVTYLSRDPSNSFMAAAAARVPVNYGTAEEVLAEHPDLVIASTAATPATRLLVLRAHLRLIALEPAENFAAIKRITRRVGHAVGEDAKAEMLTLRMDATLAALAAHAPKRRITVAGWDGGGTVPGKDTLFDAILTAAGAVNVAAPLGAGESVDFGMERLLAARPDILAFGDSTRTSPGLRTQELQHPLIRTLYAGKEIAYPELPYRCGLPQSADAAAALRRAMQGVMSRAANADGVAPRP